MDLVDSQPRNLGASGSVEDDHRAKSIGLEPTTYGVSRFGCYHVGPLTARSLHNSGPETQEP